MPLLTLECIVCVKYAVILAGVCVEWLFLLLFHSKLYILCITLLYDSENVLPVHFSAQ